MCDGILLHRQVSTALSGVENQIFRGPSGLGRVYVGLVIKLNSFRTFILYATHYFILRPNIEQVGSKVANFKCQKCLF